MAVGLLGLGLQTSCSEDTPTPAPEPTAPELQVVDFTTTIDENPSDGQSLGTVTASAADATLAYSLTEQSEAGAFAIDPSTGELSVADFSLFDYEERSSLSGTVSVTATNEETGLDSTRTASILVNLNDLADRPFITTWTVDLSNGFTVTIPTNDELSYNYTVDWGDGFENNRVTGDIDHTYDNGGTYTVSISGTFPAIRFEAAATATSIQTVEQWGDISWESFSYAFRGCRNLVSNATDVPNLSQVTRMDRAFESCDLWNPAMDSWDVSTITDMSYMFANSTAFDQDLNSWDVSKVTTMSSMFLGADGFNGDLSLWDVSSVTTFYQMFRTADAFNGDISAWNTESATTFSYMFHEARAFDKDLSDWNILSLEPYTVAGTNDEVTLSASFMFTQSGLGTTNYSEILIGWGEQLEAASQNANATAPINVRLDSSARYQGADFARNAKVWRETLVDDYGWEINDAGEFRIIIIFPL